MAEDDIFVRRLFERIRAIEWNEAKAASNRRKHGIDFDEAVEIFYGTSLLRRSDRNDEERWLRSVKRKAASLLSFLLGEETRSGSSRHAAREEMKSERIIRRKWGERREGQD